MIRREFEKVSCRQIKILKAFIQYRFYILCSLSLKASQTSTVILFKDVSFAKLVQKRINTFPPWRFML